MIALKTAPEVATALGVDVWWLNYWVNVKEVVQPQIIGQYRLFTEKQMAILRQHLKEREKKYPKTRD